MPLRMTLITSMVLASLIGTGEVKILHLSADSLCPTTTTVALPDTLRTATVVAHRQSAALLAATPVQRLDTAALRQRGVTDVGDALRRFAGVNLRDYGGAGGLKSVSIRGLGAAHTAVTFDGLPVSDAQGGQIDLGRFSTDRLATIGLEVADASPLLTAVRTLSAARITLQTARPDTAKKHITAALRGGSFSMVNPALTLSTPLSHDIAASLSGDFYFAENDYPFTLYNGKATTRQRRTNSRMQTWTAEANVAGGHDANAWSAKAYYYTNHRRLPGIVVLYTEDNNERLAEQTAFVQGQWHRSWGRLSVMTATKYNWQESRYTDIDGQYPNGRLAQYYWQRQWYATAGVQYDFLPQLAAAYATDVQHDALNSNLASTGRPRRMAWLQSVSLRAALGTLTLTARLADHHYWNHRKGGTAAADAHRFTPMASVAWTAIDSRRTRLMLRAFYQELFRVPTFTESYYYHLGSPTLSPELTRQIGGGLTLRLSDIASLLPYAALTLDGYWNRVSDRIVSIPYNLFVWRTTNMGHVRARGLDLTLDVHIRPARRHMLLLAANASLQDVSDRSIQGSVGYGCQLAYTPLHSGAASLAWENPLCGLVVHTTYASERWSSNEHIATTRLSGYAEFGLAAYRTLHLRRGQRLEIRADLLNLFDKQYAVIRRYPMPGRAWKVALKYDF